MFRKLRAIAVLAALFCLAAALQQNGHAQDLRENFVQLPKPKPLPPFAFEDAKGSSMSLKDFHGRYVLLNLWASWCGPCVHEMPSLDALQNKLGGSDFVVLPIDEDLDGRNVAPLYYSRRDIRHLGVYVDTAGRAPSVFHAAGLPTSLLIDPDGNEIGRVSGEADWSSPESVEFLKDKMANRR